MIHVRAGDAEVAVELSGAGLAPGGTPPLLLLHGFTGSSASWLQVAGRLGAGRALIMPDLLGHGRSDAPTDPRRYALDRQAEDLAAILDHLQVARVDLLGYSMGGRLALRFALAAPERVRALVLESTSPGIVDPEEREARRRADEALAAFIEREGLEAFVDRWESQPLFANQRSMPKERLAALRAQRLRSPATGLVASLRGAGAAVADPVWPYLASLSMPVLLIAGALDQKYVAIGEDMANALPCSRLEIVPESGHAVHLERPEAWTKLVLSFLEEVNQCPYSGKRPTTTPISSTRKPKVSRKSRSIVPRSGTLSVR